MREHFEREQKRVRKGPYEYSILRIYLAKHKASTRIEVRRLKSSRGSTVEIELLRGDGALILKNSYRNTVLQNPTQVKIDRIIEEYKKYADENKLC